MERKLYFDGGEKTLTFVNVQDVEPILEANKEDRSEDQFSDWSRRIARVPNTVMLQWYYEELQRGNKTLNMYGPEFDRIIARKLADPDWAHLRTDKKPTLLGFGR
jgi:hypothetical protein